MMFQNTDINFVSFGEVLFDVFGDEKKIGGAPLNIALRLNSFGFPVAVISAVGKDEDGSQLLSFMKEKGVNTEAVSEVENLQTGKVLVSLDKNGCATYDIKKSVAWDAIAYSDKISNICKTSNVLIYGSLASRDTVTRNTLLKILKDHKLIKVFDVNLRPPHYDIETLNSLMLHADLIKFNEEEIEEITQNDFSIEVTMEEKMKFIAKKAKAKAVCVTKGGNGAVLFYEGKFYYNEGYKVTLVDTVGAGDSFLGALIGHLLTENSPQESLDFACAVGGVVAGSFGANPDITIEKVKEIMV
ncbi:fructokinase [Mesonia phycicola]|uniref:Fructokinase n=1 Tax=Mesonia phycicola TaxID=579105 RepID=A0A1M6DWK5_9FLAO|nr:carbohydrate kinase [Mesonia phycicola]SHI77626.1 fructokinase [Mesonia phycicola]